MFGDRAKLMHDLMEKQRRIDSLEEINQYLRNDIASLKMQPIKSSISVIGLRGESGFQYAMEIIDVQSSMHDVTIFIKLNQGE